MTILPGHPWLAGLTLGFSAACILYTGASIRRAFVLTRAKLATEAAEAAARKLQHRLGVPSLDEQIRIAAASVERDRRQDAAARARVGAASNMPEASPLTAGERERLGRMLTPERPAALDLGYSMRFTPNQEQRMRDLIREEIAKARAREMGAE